VYFEFTKELFGPYGMARPHKSSVDDRPGIRFPALPSGSQTPARESARPEECSDRREVGVIMNINRAGAISPRCPEVRFSPERVADEPERVADALSTGCPKTPLLPRSQVTDSVRPEFPVLDAHKELIT
jgi:hypothetical protein